MITAVPHGEGFEVEKGIAGLETAFLASPPSRSNGPKIAFLAEYDALPGVGHACGHNIPASSAVGAALAAGKIKERLPGTLQIFGNALCERLSPDASIHGIIIHGGERTSIVPNFSQCRFSVRSPRREHRDELVEKLKKIVPAESLWPRDARFDSVISTRSTTL